MTQIYIKGMHSAYEAEHLVRLFLHESSLAKTYPNSAQNANAAVVHVTKNKIMCAVRNSGKVTMLRKNISDILSFNALQNNSSTQNLKFAQQNINTNSGQTEDINALPIFGTMQNTQYEKDEFLRKRVEYTVCEMLYTLLCETTKTTPPWGMLTGVRPVRLIHDMRRKNFTEQQIKNRLCTQFFVSEDKYALALNIANAQSAPFGMSNKFKRPYSLYISIPFCPTRCSYCSFVSQPTAHTKKLIEPYMQKLVQELRLISRIAQQNNMELVTIYIGGGTPTAVSEQQLLMLMSAVRENFDISKILEYTVEAGRPDCTTLEKLKIIKEYGATRISINPQTLNDEVLLAIGRQHTAQDIITCFENARRAGHENINTDIIAGLPKDTQKGFENTLNGVLALKPENITVHTLTLKRASDIVIKNTAKDSADVNKMVRTAHKIISESAENYMPYYLYRQKSTPGNLENTGYAKNGYTGLYNIFIMEEVHTIMSAGAGGVSKLVSNTGEITRIFNHKYPTEYIERFDIVCERKKGVEDFYGKHVYLDT